MKHTFSRQRKIFSEIIERARRARADTASLETQFKVYRENMCWWLSWKPVLSVLDVLSKK